MKNVLEEMPINREHFECFIVLCRIDIVDRFGFFSLHFIHFNHIDFQFKIFLFFSVSFITFFCVPKLNFIDFSRFCLGSFRLYSFFFKLLLIFFLGRMLFFLDTLNNVFSIEVPLFYSMSVSYTFRLMSLIRRRLIKMDTHKHTHTSNALREKENPTRRKM